MLQTAADGLLVFAFVMTVPASCLDVATRRAVRYEVRLVSILLFQLGYLIGLMWLVTAFDWSPVWHALAQVRSVNPVGWVVNLMFIIGLASPLLSALCAVDTLRHPYVSRLTPAGHRVLIPARYLRPAY